MTLYNYFLTGVLFTLFIDILLYICKEHPSIVKAYPHWNWTQRILCMLLWPITSTYLTFMIIKQFFKK